MSTSRRNFLGKLAGAAVAVPLAPILIADGGEVSAVTDPAALRAMEARQLFEAGLMSEDDARELLESMAKVKAKHELLCPECHTPPCSTIVNETTDKGAPVYRNTCERGHRWVVQ